MKSKLIYSTDPCDMGYTEEYAIKSFVEIYGEEPTADELYDRLNMLAEDSYSYFKSCIKSYMKRFDVFLLTGEFGRWDGPVGVHALIEDASDLFNALRLRGDYNLVFEDVGGKLKITQSHHDGTNYYELRPLTKKGMAHYNAKYMPESRNSELLNDLDSIKCYTKNANYLKVMEA